MKQIARDILKVGSEWTEETEGRASRLLLTGGPGADRDRKKGIAALNGVLLRMITGEDVSPSMRWALAAALTEIGVEFVPRQTTRGRPREWWREMHVVRDVLDEQCRSRGKREAAYRVAAKRYGLTLRHVRRIVRRYEEKMRKGAGHKIAD
jgi:hypothetical protein